AQRPGPGALGLGAGTVCTRTLGFGAGTVGGGTAGVGAINTGTVGGPEQPHLRAMGEVLEPLGVSAAVVVEGVHAPALGHDPVQVDVGGGGARALWEALTLPQQVAAFVDEGLPVPGQVGGRFALAGGGIEVGHLAARGGGGDHQGALICPADGDRRAGQVG